MRRVLIYGDSNVWGDYFYGNQRAAVRWADIVSNKLGDQYQVIQSGLNGRVAGDFDSDKPHKNGRSLFYGVWRSAAPVDVIIIALGTNDLQARYHRGIDQIASDLLWYTNRIQADYVDPDNAKYFVDDKMPKIIYLLPPNIKRQDVNDLVFNPSSEDKRQLLNARLSKLPIDTMEYPGDLDLTDDGVHLSAVGHRKMADFVLSELRNRGL